MMWRRYARIFGADPKADVQDELSFHLQAKRDELVTQGWTPEAAYQEAAKQFGDLRPVLADGERLGRELRRKQRNKDYRGALTQDIRYAFRTLRREPGFTFVTILIFALGIAANTTVFSVVNTVLLRPLPFPDSDRLAWLAAGRSLSPEIHEVAGLSGVTYNVAFYEELQRRNQSFEQIASYNPFFGNSEYTLTGHGEPQPVAGVMVSENFFPTLQVKPELGRLFSHHEMVKGGPTAVLLTHAFWVRQFGGDPAILGQTVFLNKQIATVIGILPASFDFGQVFSPGGRFEVFVPAIMGDLRTWGNTLALVGRLKPGITAQRAQAEADVLIPRLLAEHKDWWDGYASNVTTLKDFVSGKLRRSLIVLWGAVGVILLIVCVNLSNLFLARQAARAKEFAVRGALGAGRGRLVRQVLTEGFLLSTIGGLLGLSLSVLLTLYIARQGSVALPLLSNVRVDAQALLWTLAITVVTGLLFSLIPALKLSAGDLQDTLKDSAAGLSSGRGQERLRNTLVICEVALTCVLLVGAGLLLRSFLRVLDVDLGFQPSRALTMRVDYDQNKEGAYRHAALAEMLRRVTAIPGVEAAGVTDMLPLGRNRSWGVQAKGKTYQKGIGLAAVVRIVTPGYLQAMGMRLREGRDFTWADNAKSEPIMILNQTAARILWQGDDPLGQVALMNGNTRVVGVLADVKEHGVEAPSGPEMYLPVSQASPEGAELVIRTRLSADALAGSVMKTLRAWNPSQPMTELQPLQTIVDRAVSPRRFFVALVGCFAALGLTLASLGIYGVIAYSVTQQRKEIGIRMALGASVSTVRRAVIAKALKLSLYGAAAGLLCAYGAAKGIQSLLFGTNPEDPGTFAAIVVLLCLVALLAGYLPARRASKVDPMIALRNS